MNTTRKSFSLILGLGLAALSFAPQAQAGTVSKLFFHTPVKLVAAASSALFANDLAFNSDGEFRVVSGLKELFFGNNEKDKTTILQRLTNTNRDCAPAVFAIGLGAASLICLKSWLNAITASDAEPETEDDYGYSNY